MLKSRPSFSSCILSSPLVSVDRAKRIEIRRQEEEIFNATTDTQEELVRALNGPTPLSGPGWPEESSHPFPWAVIFAPCRLTKATIGNSSPDSSPLGCRSIITIFVFTDVPKPDDRLNPLLRAASCSTQIASVAHEAKALRRRKCSPRSRDLGRTPDLSQYHLLWFIRDCRAVDD